MIAIAIVVARAWSKMTVAQNAVSTRSDRFCREANDSLPIAAVAAGHCVLDEAVDRSSAMRRIEKTNMSHSNRNTSPRRSRGCLLQDT